MALDPSQQGRRRSVSRGGAKGKAKAPLASIPRTDRFQSGRSSLFNDWLCLHLNSNSGNG